MRSPCALTLAVLLATFASAWPRGSTAEPENWQGYAYGGGELNLAPRLPEQPTGHGWAAFDSRGVGIVGGGDLHLFYNTTKLPAGIERFSFAQDKLALFAFVEGEAVISQLLNDYFERGRRIDEFGFKASYVLASAKLQWYPGRHQTLEVILAARHWWFGNRNTTSANYVLPDDTWVFEPRIGYNYWNVDVPAEEWEALRMFPRIEGIALQITGGLDLRSSSVPWGLGDGRNDPGNLIYSVDESLRAGWRFGSLVRLQLDQWGRYGWRQDDITRSRIGGVSPYVIPVPGLPWPALISERFFAGQLGLHLRAKPSSPHEFGVLVGGGAFNDVKRTGALGSYGGTGGLALFGDLRFGPSGRYQLDLRVSWGFPTSWLIDPPYLSGLVAFGVRIF